jgi:hypothetical protein
MSRVAGRAPRQGIDSFTEFVSKKREKDVKQLVGAPEIAHSDDGERWELQTAFVTAWVLEMWERVGGADKKIAHETRAELQTFFLNNLGQMLRLALADRQSNAKRWACRVLADIFVSIGKHVGKIRIKKPYGKLMETKAFLDQKKFIGKVRTNVLFPGMIRAIAQHELKRAGQFRKRLLFLKDRCISEHQQKAKYGNVSINAAEKKGIPLTWKQAAKKQKIPQEYWPAMDSPEFSVKSEPQWWKFLWPLIQKNSDHQQLLELAERKYRAARTRCFADFEKTTRDHLKALARLRDKGRFWFF